MIGLMIVQTLFILYMTISSFISDLQIATIAGQTVSRKYGILNVCNSLIFVIGYIICRVPDVFGPGLWSMITFFLMMILSTFITASRKWMIEYKASVGASFIAFTLSIFLFTTGRLYVPVVNLIDYLGVFIGINNI